jgi:hypothetical protein
MASYDEVMRALRNADAAGDTAAASRLAKLADGMRTQAEKPGHGVRLTSGSLGKGVANTLGAPVDITTAGINTLTGGINKLTGSNIGPIERPFGGSDLIGKGLEKLGVPLQEQPLTRGERLYSRAIEGAGSALLPIPGMPLVSTLGKEAALGAAAGLGSQGVREAFPKVPGPIADLVGGIGGAGALGRTVNTAGRAVNVARGEVNPTMKAAQEAGVELPLAGDATGRAGIQKAQTALRDAPGSSGIIREAEDRTVNSFDAAMERETAKLGATSKEGAGSVIQGGLEGARERFQANSNFLYDRLYAVVPKTTPVRLDNTKAVLDEVASEMPDAEEWAKTLMSQTFAKQRDALSGKETVNWQTIRRARTEIGKKLTDPTFLTDETRANWKRLYGALSDDLRGAAESAGALNEFEVANSFYAQGVAKLEAAAKGLTAKGITPETVFNVAMGEARSGGTRLAQLREALAPEEWDVLAGTALREMGMQTPGAAGAVRQFSPATFLTNWNRMSASAKFQLFGGKRYTELRHNLNNLAEVADAIKSTARNANNSRTAGTSAFMQMLQGVTGSLGGVGGFVSGGTPGAMVGAVGGVAGPMITANLSARLLTNPAFVKWLATPVGAAEMPKALRRLAVVANANTTENREDIKAFLSAATKGLAKE